MAKRKQKTDPRQMTLFEMTARHIEELRENSQKDTEEILILKPLRSPAKTQQGRKQRLPKAEPQKQHQHSLFDVVLTEQPVTLKTKDESHDRPSNHPVGTGVPRARTGHNQGNQSLSGLRQNSLFDLGSLGDERTGSPEAARDDRQDDNAATGSSLRSGYAGRAGSVQRSRDSDEHERHVGLGDSGAAGRGYEARNYRITPADELGVGSAAVKFEDNIRAISVLKELLQKNAKVASPEEKQVLVRYVGWGGLPQAFDAQNEQWREQYHKVQSLLSDDEYAQARRSTQDAHYTSETVIRGIYSGLSRLGVGKDTAPLRILEPSAGIGHFIGLCPEKWNADFKAIERDPISSQIASYLYPEADHILRGYQHVNISSQFDVVLGNPPFGKQRLFDQKHPDLSKFSIHNYFLAKSIDKLREGGVGAFVVSRYFMDAVDSSAREHIAEHAELLGAIRLPNSAFRQNALTDVTTDIVFFRKTSSPKDKSWVSTRPYSVWNEKEKAWEEVPLNSYFADHPDQIIGQLVKTSGAYQGEVSCVADSSLLLSEEIERRLSVLPSDVFSPREESQLAALDEEDKNKSFIESEYFQSLKIGAYCVEPRTGKIVAKAEGELGADTYEPVSLRRETERVRLTSLIRVRDSLRQLLNAEKDPDVDDGQLRVLRAQLNQRYDAFVKKFGFLNSQLNRSLFRDDPESALVQSLEVRYDKGISKEVAKRTGAEARPPSAEKAAIFSRRMLAASELAVHAETAQDALVISLRETGKIAFHRMAELVGKTQEEIRLELERADLIFLNPANSQWEIKDHYLTGDVRGKLALAQEAALSDGRFQRNVNALAKVQPPDIEAVDIGVQFGATWIPKEDMSAFFDEVIHGGNGKQHVVYLPVLGKWDIGIQINDYTRNTSTWGIPEYPAERLIQSMLRNTPIKVEKDTGEKDQHGNPIKVVDSELTAAAMQKADEIRQAFKDWIWQDDERRTRLEKLYNERFNTHIPPVYDGSHVQLSSANPEIHLRPHQKNVIWRSLQEGTGLFDHVVGAGKTMACIATIMESKRMGLVSKPMVVVPNHLIYQWRDEFFKLYPDAKLLVADKDDFTKAKRERLFSRVATGDWDAILVTHSSFGKIERPHEMEQQIINEQIKAAMDAVEYAKDTQGSRATIKQLEKQRERLLERYQKLLARGGEKDKAVDFSDLGIDALFVDEAQEFKNLAFTTTMNVSGLGNIAGSAKATDLYIKCRYLQEKNNGRGVFFLTGTPISNSIAEVFTLQRYLQGRELVKKELEHFDAWAATFGQVTSGWELDATGVNYKLKSRFASFQNVPELLAMYRSFADVVTAEDLERQALKNGEKRLTPPLVGGAPQNIVADRSPAQAKYMERIIDRMENLPRDPRLDNPLKITNDARKAGLDFRLIVPDAEDFAGSKVNAAVERIFELWQKTADVRGTQLVFCDLSTPKGGAVSTTNQEPETQTFEADIDIDGTLVRESEPADDDDVIVIEGEEDDDDAVKVSMDDMLAQSAKFSVYDDMKRKLMAKGIPADQIAFIHDANTDLRKSKLFDDMQEGRVRILMGSTPKMGAGTNVQKRLVAAHHLDAPWRPSDLAQRNGRIIRQGNALYNLDPENFKVEINYYATKQTYDARMWQTIEYKAAAIEQFRTGSLLQRVIDDVSSEAATAAEMKAAASGNPLILKQVQLAADLKKLEALAAQFQRGQYRMRDRLKWLEKSDERFGVVQTVFDANIALRDRNSRRIISEDGRERYALDLVVNGKLFHSEDKRELQKLFAGSLTQLPKETLGKQLPIATYRGFEFGVVQHRADSKNFQFYLKGANDATLFPGNMKYEFGEKISISGFFQRMDNFLDKTLAQIFEDEKAQYQREKSEISSVKEQLSQEFPQKKELELVRENHAAVLRELKRMQDEPGYVSEWKPKKLSDITQENEEEKKQEFPQERSKRMGI